MNRSRIAVAIAALAALVTSAGCRPKIYRAETVVRSDGSLSRAIYQPIEATPPEARTSKAWTNTTYAKRIAHESFHGPISNLPRADHDEDHDYFAAWGEFESIDRLPQSYVKAPPRGLPEGKLLADYERNDYVLVVEHRWQEVLTDIVSIDDMHQARQELAEIMVPLLPKILAEVLGDEYDTALVGKWLEEHGQPWFFELTDVVFAAGARGDQLDEMTLVPLCARHGLVLTDASGKLLQDEALSQVVEAYVREVLRDTLRRRDGKKVPERTIATLLEWFTLKDRPEDSNERYEALNAAADKVVVDQFGSQQAFQDAMKPLLARLLGLYGGELFSEPHRFHYTLEVPGGIVSTNGTLLSERKVRWEFDGGDAYPFGYRMECRALEPRMARVEALLGRQALEDNEARLAFIALVSRNASLLELLRTCAAANSMHLFYTVWDESAPGSAQETACERLAELLKLPKEPPAE